MRLDQATPPPRIPTPSPPLSPKNYFRNMCRNIRPLFNFNPPITDDEVRNAALQFVRKISGFSKPSKSNEAAFYSAIDAISAASSKLLISLETSAPPKNREDIAAKAKARSRQRFGSPDAGQQGA